MCISFPFNSSNLSKHRCHSSNRNIHAHISCHCAHSNTFTCTDFLLVWQGLLHWQAQGILIPQILKTSIIIGHTFPFSFLPVAIIFQHYHEDPNSCFPSFLLPEQTSTFVMFQKQVLMGSRLRNRRSVFSIPCNILLKQFMRKEPACYSPLSLSTFLSLITYLAPSFCSLKATSYVYHGIWVWCM